MSFSKVLIKAYRSFCKINHIWWCRNKKMVVMSIMLMKVNPGLFSKTKKSLKKKKKKRKKNTKINVTTEGNRHFGAVVGSNDL